MNKVLVVLGVLFALLSTSSNALAETSEVIASLQISSVHFDGNSPCGTFYGPQSYDLNLDTGKHVWLVGNSDGNAVTYVDDLLEIQITHQDGSTSTFTHNYGNGSQIAYLEPTDVTSYLKVGVNHLVVNLKDTLGPICNSSQLWLVTTGTSTPAPDPVKPTVISRDTWGGPNIPGLDTDTKNHIVIHHTNTSNSTSAIGIFAEELSLTNEFCAQYPWSYLGNVLNHVDCLTQIYADYPKIRFTWKGKIWRIFENHTYIKDPPYDDIGYHYLIDPDGNIYEGRTGEDLHKGESVEKANTGVIGIAFIGKFGYDGVQDQLTGILKGGLVSPTDAAINSFKNLVKWLMYKHHIEPLGKFQLPTESCQFSDRSMCFVDNIAGHKDFFPLTGVHSTVCPGDNLYSIIPTLRNSVSSSSVDTTAVLTGILFNTFDPLSVEITDPNGKRIYYVPSTKTYVNEIPNSMWTLDEPFEHDFQGEPSDRKFWFNISTPVDGVYIIKTTGRDSRNFAIGITNLANFYTMLQGGTTVVNQVDTFQLLYDSTTTNHVELWHDLIPPVTTAEIQGKRDNNGIFRDDVKVTIAASDVGSGVKLTQYSLDNGTTWNTITNNTFTLTGNGIVNVLYRSVDKAGNVETAKSSGPIFISKYTLFSGSTGTSMWFSSPTNTEVKGKAHSNGTVNFQFGAVVDLLGGLETTSVSNAAGNTFVNIVGGEKIVPGVPYYIYPLSILESQATTVYNSAVTFNSTTPMNGLIYVNGNATLKNLVINGPTVLAVNGMVINDALLGPFTGNSNNFPVVIYAKSTIEIGGPNVPKQIHYISNYGDVVLDGVSLNVPGTIMGNRMVVGSASIFDVAYQPLTAVTATLPLPLPNLLTQVSGMAGIVPTLVVIPSSNGSLFESFETLSGWSVASGVTGLVSSTTFPSEGTKSAKVTTNGSWGNFSKWLGGQNWGSFTNLEIHVVNPSSSAVTMALFMTTASEGWKQLPMKTVPTQSVAILNFDISSITSRTSVNSYGFIIDTGTAKDIYVDNIRRIGSTGTTINVIPSTNGTLYDSFESLSGWSKTAALTSMVTSNQYVSEGANSAKVTTNGSWGNFSKWVGGENWSSYNKVEFHLVNPSTDIAKVALFLNTSSGWNQLPMQTVASQSAAIVIFDISGIASRTTVNSYGVIIDTGVAKDLYFDNLRRITPSTTSAQDQEPNQSVFLPLISR